MEINQVINLDSFNDHKNYYDLYINNNIRLKEIIEDIVNKYNFEYNPQKYYRMNPDDIITRNIYELSGLIIMLNAIIEKNCYGYCIKTKKKYICEKMCYSNSNITKFCYTTYHFNCSNDEFIILFGWEYFSPMCIYYPKTKTIFNISYRFSNVRFFINTCDINFSNPYYSKNNFISYSIGLMHNPGHYFWQEIYGLMLLFEYNLIDNIDEFIIYNYDYLNISEMLEKKHNKKIININSNFDKHNITINLSKCFVSNSLIETFKNFYELEDIKNTNEINILIDIRTNDRIWLNQNIIIISIINTLKNKYADYNVNFYISGFYTYKNKINSYYDYHKEINIQNMIFNKIQKSVKFPIYNLINANLCDIVKICQKIDVCIANIGSGSSFFYQTIFNKNCICLTLNNKIRSFNLQRYAFENNLDKSIFVPRNYIIDYNNNFYLKYGILLEIITSIIDKSIINSK